MIKTAIAVGPHGQHPKAFYTADDVIRSHLRYLHREARSRYYIGDVPQEDNKKPASQKPRSTTTREPARRQPERRQQQQQRRNPPYQRQEPFRREPFRREPFRASSGSGPTSNVVVNNDNAVVRRSTFNDQRCAIVTDAGRAAKADGISLRGKCPAVFTSTKMTPEDRFSQCPCPRKPGHEGPYAPAHTGVPSQEIRAKWSRTQGPGAFSKRIDWSEAVRRFGL